MAAYLGNGQYNLLDVINRSKDPSINYDGLYQDPSRDQGSYTSNPFKAMTSSDYQYMNSKSLNSAQARDQDNPFSDNMDVPVNRRMRLDNMDYNKGRPLGRSYGGPQGSQFNNFDPRIGRPEVVSDFEAGEDGSYLGGNYPENPYPDNTELGDMTGLVTDQFYDQIDKAPTITDMIDDNQYDVNDAALGIMQNAFNQRQIMADETSVGNYPTEPQNLGFIESAPQPKEAIYQDRIMNNNLPSYGYEPRQGILQGLRSKIGSGFNNVKDFAIDKGRMGKNLIGAGAAKFAGLPGMVGSGLMSLLSNLGNGVDYQQYTPGFDYNGLNDSMINDFYDPATGLNRFDRARRKGNTFASARTGAEYFKLRREKKAQDKINAAAATKAAEAAARGNYTPGGSHLSRGTSGGGLGLSQAQAQSVSQANKDAGYSSFSGLKDGGLASMFTRRR